MNKGKAINEGDFFLRKQKYNQCVLAILFMKCRELIFPSY